MNRSAAVAGGLVATIVAVASLLAWRDDSPLVPREGGTVAAGGGTWFLVLLAAAFGAYLVGLTLLGRGGRLIAVAAIALVIQLVPLAAPVLLSTDAWTYWSYGWIASEGDNPYRTTPGERPANPALPHMGADWRDRTSVYGPVFTLASDPVARVAGDNPDLAGWLFKGLAAAAVLAATGLAAALSRNRPLATAFVGWNPVLAIHAAGGGHNDALLGALLVSALALERIPRPAAAGLAWALGTFVKWVPAPLLALRLLDPTMTQRRRVTASTAVAAGALAVVASVVYGNAWLGAAGPLLDNATLETSFALPARLEQLGLPHVAALAVAGGALVVAAGVLARQARTGRPRLAAGACVLLVTTPYLAVWYLLWAVPLAAADDDDRAARVCCLAICAYLLPQAIPR